MGTLPHVRLDFASATHRGVVRRVNEDSVLANGGVFCVADGIGGEGSGDVASQIVTRQLGALAGRPIGDGEVAAALAQAHEEVAQFAQDRPRGAASTACGCVVLEVDGTAYWQVFNIGDSRLYRCAGAPGMRRIKQITVDHSLVQEMVDSGALSRAEAYTHPQRNVVTRAIGAAGFRPDFWMLPMVEGERLMICTDGLLTDSPPEDVRDLLKSQRPADEVTAGLLHLALVSGARDNVSVVLIDVVAD